MRGNKRSLTSVEDPKGDKLDLDNFRDNTHPESSKGVGSKPGYESSVVVNENAYTEKSRDCKSLRLLPSCGHEMDKINETAAWMKTLVYT